MCRKQSRSTDYIEITRRKVSLQITSRPNESIKNAVFIKWRYRVAQHDYADSWLVKEKKKKRERSRCHIFIFLFFPENQRGCAFGFGIHRGFDFDVAANNNAIYSAHSLTTDPPRLRRSMRADLPVLLLHLRDPRCTLRARRFYRTLFISIFLFFFLEKRAMRRRRACIIPSRNFAPILTSNFSPLRILED